MDTTTKKQKPGIVLAVLLLLACAFFFITYGLYVGEATRGEEVSTGQVIYTLYAYGGFGVICLAGIAVAALSNVKKKAVVSRVFMWGTILLAYHFATQFFANAFNLAVMTFQKGLIYSSEYIPSLLLVAALIAVLCQWNAENRKAAAMISWISLLVSAFLAGWFIYHKLTSMISLDAVIVYDALFGVAHAVVTPVAIGFLFQATRKNEAFRQSFIK